MTRSPLNYTQRNFTRPHACSTHAWPRASINLLILSVSLGGLFAPYLTGAQELSGVDQLPGVEQLKTLPIDLDADSSEFDRKNNKLLFRGLTISQGTLKIEADEATAERLDFENSRWEFSGNVRIKNVATTAYADYADIHFQEHQIRRAEMRGQPVRFSQQGIDKDTITEGHALTMDYDVSTGIISMSEEAWLSDGANEVSGNRISYDLLREYIIADADETGQVRMKIIPPENAAERPGVKPIP